MPPALGIRVVVETHEVVRRSRTATTIQDATLLARVRVPTRRAAGPPRRPAGPAPAIHEVVGLVSLLTATRLTAYRGTPPDASGHRGRATPPRCSRWAPAARDQARSAKASTSSTLPASMSRFSACSTVDSVA